jgi:PAS domain S-box-containing protein
MSVSADATRPEVQHAGIRADPSTYADDRTKSKKQLLQELIELRQQVRVLQTRDHQDSSFEIDTRSITLGLRELVAVSPAIIYTTKASGNYACTFVSDNLRYIMGYAPIEMTTDPKYWPDHLHPDDAPLVLKELGPLIKRGGGTVEYRFRHRDGHYIWIQDTFRVITDQTGHAFELVGAWADITKRKFIETELIGTRQRLQYLLSVNPSIIYTTKASGD